MSGKVQPGEGKRHYPWGDEWVEGRCNVAGEGTTKVTAFEDGASAYGALDMLGNVQEWTRSAWGSNPNTPEFTYEAYDAEDGRPFLGKAAYQQVPGRPG